MPLLQDFLGAMNGGQAPYETDPYGQIQGGGLLGSFGRGLQNNSDSLMQFGLGMLGGKDISEGFQNAAQGYARGSLLDRQRTIDLRNQMKEAERRRAAQAYAQGNTNLSPGMRELAVSDPDFAAKLGAADYQKKLNPDNGQIIGSADVGYWRVMPDGSKQPIIGPQAPQPSQTERLIQQLPEDQQMDARRAALGMGGGVNDYDRLVEQRRKQAEASGLKPDDPRYNSFVLTGKFPREDAQPLTATDKKFIMEADEGVQAAQTAITNLQEAKKLSKSALSGPGAATRGYGWSLLGDKSGQDTEQLNNLVMTNALTQLKSIFGAAPTEGERAILLDIQGSVNKPDAVRQEIYDRAIKMAQRRLVLNQQRANQLRGGDFYKSGGGMSVGDAPPPVEGQQQAPDPLGIR